MLLVMTGNAQPLDIEGLGVVRVVAVYHATSTTAPAFGGLHNLAALNRMVQFLASSDLLWVTSIVQLAMLMLTL